MGNSSYQGFAAQTGDLVGAVVSTGVVTSLGSFSSADLRGALTDESGTGAAYFAGGNLGTPSAGVATNLTGTAAGLTAGNVTTNANMTGDVTSSGSNATTLKTNLKSAPLTVRFDGNLSAIPINTTIMLPIAYAGTITGYKIMCDTGTITIKTWKKAAGTAIPTVADVISTSGVSLSTGTAVQSTTTSDFTTTAVAAGDMFAFTVTAISGATWCVFQLDIART